MIHHSLSFILLSLFICPSTQQPSSCDDHISKCNWLYQNVAHSSSTFTTAIPQGVPLSLVTFRVGRNPDGAGSGRLSFWKDNNNQHALSVAPQCSLRGFTVFGKSGGVKYSTAFEGVSSKINELQISSDPSDSYSLFFGENKETFNYEGAWGKFSSDGMLLGDANVIQSPANKCVYFYDISACVDAVPQLCGTNTETIPVQLGESLTISCSGTGAPILMVRWEYDGTEITGERLTTNYNNSSATQQVTSTLDISNIVTGDLGAYTCSISNQNFGNAQYKTFEVSYTSPIKLDYQPEFSYFLPEDSLTWVVSGWPLEGVALSCNSPETPSKYVDVASSPPSMTFFLTLAQGIDRISCALTSGDTILVNRTFTRVGVGCLAGQKGVETSCVWCPHGQTSPAGSDKCFLGDNTCTEGLYQKDGVCGDCPDGETSLEGAAKVEDCYGVQSTCDDGYFGHGGVCNPCPVGHFSQSAVKESECNPAVSNCDINYYGIGASCKVCPLGTLGPADTTVKVEDCQHARSFCMIGYWGEGTVCVRCPVGQISQPAAAVKIEDCEEVEGVCSQGQYGYQQCSDCPIGKISDDKEAVKESDCHEVESSCQLGEYGVADQCTVCPIETTAPPRTAVKVSDCTAVDSTCDENYWGTGSNCSLCPSGAISGESTVKPQECYQVGEYADCEAGQFGYGGVCSSCPLGFTSDARSAVKVSECDSETSLCDSGLFGVNSDCYKCPEGSTSDHNIAVKQADCYDVSSSCSVGDYGIDDTCSPCPIGETSIAGTVKLQDCYSATPTCEAGQYGHEGAECRECPVGESSSPRTAVKLTDCEGRASECLPGEYGEGEVCWVCPPRTTSPRSTAVKEADCQAAESACLGGFWGVGEGCSPCPGGHVSELGTVKEQDCEKVDGICPETQYGYKTCSDCPLGETSIANSSVKITDCIPASSFCSAGEYGINTTCSTCPTGSTTDHNTAVKEADCREVAGECLAGFWGVGGDCLECGVGLTSVKGAVKRQECLPIVCSPGQYLEGSSCSLCPKGYTSEKGAAGISECQEEPKKSSAGAIAGGIIGGIAIVCAVGLVFYCLKRSRKSPTKEHVAFIKPHTPLIERTETDGGDPKSLATNGYPYSPLKKETSEGYSTINERLKDKSRNRGRRELCSTPSTSLEDSTLQRETEIMGEDLRSPKAGERVDNNIAKPALNREHFNHLADFRREGGDGISGRSCSATLQSVYQHQDRRSVQQTQNPEEVYTKVNKRKPPLPPIPPPSTVEKEGYDSALGGEEFSSMYDSNEEDDIWNQKSTYPLIHKTIKPVISDDDEDDYAVVEIIDPDKVRDRLGGKDIASKPLETDYATIVSFSDNSAYYNSDLDQDTMNSVYSC